MLALGLGGFTLMNVSEMNNGVSKNQEQCELQYKINDRLSKTFGWFGYGICTTALTISQMRHSFVWASIHPVFWLTGATISWMAAHDLSYKKSYELKVTSYTAFTACIGMMLLPIL